MCDHRGHCEHAHAEEDLSSSFSLFKHIDIVNLQCLNESIVGAGKKIFKPYEDRKSFSPSVENDCEGELLFNIPFTGVIKLKGIIVSGEAGDSHPDMINLFKNRPFMTFSDADCEADQIVELHPDPFGEIVYPCKAAKFSNVHHLSILVKKRNDSDTLKLHYIGLRGDFTEARRTGIVLTNYEVTPNAADHKTDLLTHASYFVE